MWFRFPEGVDQISVEQQLFHPEAEDDEGRKFFRAPDHFAPTLLGLPGFSRSEPPEGAPEDLPPSDPKRAEAVDKLSAEMESLREENTRLRQELGAARRERDGLQTKVDDLESEIVEIKNDRVKEVVVPKPGAASTTQPPIVEEKSNAGKTSPGPTQNKPAGR